MPRRILIAAANPWSWSLAVERELARQHSDDQVDMVDVWQLCARFSPHWSPRDRLIERINRKIPRFLRRAINGRDITSEIRLDHSAIPPLIQDLTQLPFYKVGPGCVGLGVLSSIYEITTIQHMFAAPGDYGEVLPDAWRAAHLSQQLGERVAAMNYDRVYIFGGRHSYSRPFCDVVATSSEMFRYEQGWSGTSYVMSQSSIYEPKTIADIIAELPFDEQVGEHFYQERLSHSPESDASFFTANQVEGHVPEPLLAKPIVTLFTTSVDEMYGIKDTVRFGDFATQYEAALALARICSKRGMALAVRLHPHLAFKHRSWMEEWDFEALRALGAEVIMPSDPTDTYALARASRCVFTCGSTTGFECTYLGVPNAVVGDWLGAVMGACATVWSEQDMDAFVEDPRMPERAREQALRYGSAQRRRAVHLPELEVGAHPNLARLGGRIVDPVRYLVQRLRQFAANVFSRSVENRSGIIRGRVALPSGARYRTR